MSEQWDKAALELAGVGAIVMIYRDLHDTIDREDEPTVRRWLTWGGLLSPDGENLTARGEEARRAALRLLAERQVSPARIEALSGGDVARWAALADAATPEPWLVETYDDPNGVTCRYVYAAGDYGVSDELSPEDAAFIASARTAVPALCAEVERLRAALVALSEWHAIPEEIRDQVTADMLFAAPLQSESDRATTDAWEAGIRCLEAGRPRVTATELAERARLRAADPQRSLVEQIAEHAPAVHSDIVAAVEAQNPNGLTTEAGGA